HGVALAGFAVNRRWQPGRLQGLGAELIENLANDVSSLQGTTNAFGIKALAVALLLIEKLRFNTYRPKSLLERLDIESGVALGLSTRIGDAADRLTQIAS